MADNFSMEVLGAGSPDRVNAVTQELLRDLRRLGELEATAASRPVRPGERAIEVPIIGQILLSFISAGAAKALIDCLKAYLARDRRMSFVIKEPGGRELSVTAENVGQAEFMASVETFRQHAAAPDRP